MSREELIGWGRGGCRGVKTDADVYSTYIGTVCGGGWRGGGAWRAQPLSHSDFCAT